MSKSNTKKARELTAGDVIKVGKNLRTVTGVSTPHKSMTGEGIYIRLSAAPRSRPYVCCDADKPYKLATEEV